VFLPLPPLPEQKAIAYVLRTVQEAKEATEKVISSLQELKKSLMKHLFTYGAVPVEGIDKVELKDTEIGKIPAHWKVVRLGDVAKIKYGYRTKIPKVSEPDGIPIISMADITSEGQILWDSIRRIKVNQAIIQKHQLDDGEVLFNWRNSPEHIGKTAIFKKISSGPYICASFILRIKTNEKYLNNIFLHYQIMFMKMNGYFTQKSRRAVGQTNFNAFVLKSLSIPLPPLDEQHQIAHILQTVDQKIEAEKKRKEALENLFKSLLYNLMSAKVRLPREFVKRFEGENVHV